MHLTRAFPPASSPRRFAPGVPGDVATHEAAGFTSRGNDKQGDTGQAGPRGCEPAEHRQSSAELVTKLTFQTPHGSAPAIPPGDRKAVSWRGLESHE